MKIFKILALLTISSLMFTGCDGDDITNYAFQEISAPSNVTATFNVAQDDSGKVSITPSGDGASVFQIYFGDVENETPLEARPGETVTNVYEEGEYLARVVAIGPTGLTSEYNQMLTISFRAPENLKINVDQPANNPATISLSATADFAMMFDVYFGDVEDEEPTQLMPGESIQHTYEAPGTYIIRVVAKGAGVATTEGTVEVVVPEANDPVKLPITYDIPTVNYALGTFNGAEFEVVTNPFLTGENTEENMVGKLTNNGGQFEGGAYNLGESVDFSGNNKTISMKFYSDQPVSVLVKFEGGETNADRANEVSVEHGGTGWEILNFNFGTDAVKSFIDGDPENGQAFVPTGKYSALVLFVEIGKTTAGTFYFDDIKQVSASFASSKVEDFEGTAPTFTVFGNIAPTEVVANPDPSGNNTTSKVAKFTKSNGAEFFGGTFFEISSPLDLESLNFIRVKTFSPKVGAVVKLKLENQDASITHEVDVRTTVANQWENLNFDFSGASAADYVRIVIFFDFENPGDGSVYYFDEVELTNGATEPPVAMVFQDFEGDAPEFTVFGNIAQTEVVANPDSSGANTTAKVAKLTKSNGSEVFAGTFFEISQPLNFDDFSKISVKTFSPKNGAVVKLKLENQDGSITHEKDLNTSVINQWESLVYDFSDAPDADYVRVVIFFDFGNSGDDSIYYFDQFALTN